MKSRTKRETIIAVAIVLVALVLAGGYFIHTSRRGQPRIKPLWAEGRYVMPHSLRANTVADVMITDFADIAVGKNINFQICATYRYFKITVFHSYPALASLVTVGLSDGQLLSITHPANHPGGVTQIISTTQPWPHGRHYVTLQGLRADNVSYAEGTGEIHVMVATAANPDVITQGIVPPPPHERLTVQAESVAPGLCTLVLFTLKLRPGNHGDISQIGKRSCHRVAIISYSHGRNGVG
ncbi:MAG: hypothetical protein FWC32_04545 [Firmicutes bacterium]|nr:hypothetical protein [Bacillota bacterium]